jgi:leucyl/phenylalanyl-tRNA--protein transferase
VIEAIHLPHPLTADEQGLVAIGGDFNPALLLAAYANGIFPWPSEDLPKGWFSPDPRMVLPPREFHLSQSLRKLLRSGRYQCTFDRAFAEVLAACAGEQGRAEEGTWIDDELREGFQELHRLGLAHSVEAWEDGSLVGGLYGLSLGGMFCGESMFHRRPNASKAAFAALAERLAGWDFLFIDCQVYSGHLAALGAREWSRRRFLRELGQALAHPTRIGSWNR